MISVAPTFLNVGSNGPITLGDIAVNDAGLEGGLFIRFFDEFGNPLSEGDYVYVQANTLYGMGDADGWYTANAFYNFDFDATNCRNSKQIPVGTGFVLIPSTSGAALKFVGEVKNGEKEITGNVGDLIRVGNATPKNYTLADIQVNSAGLEGGLFIRFFNEFGNPLAEGDYVYVQANTLYGMGDADGWYTANAFYNFDFDAANCRNNVSVEAGKGFVLIPSTSGAALIVPNPLAAN